MFSFLWETTEQRLCTALCICFCVVLCGNSALGNVEILQPFHPLYVKEGEQLEIRCVSNERRSLEWVRQTEATAWMDKVIVPVLGADWSVRTINEEPTGYVESVLIKHHVNINDRGMYLCRDTENIYSYSIWITALRISKRNVTAYEEDVPVTLHCNLTGFDNNPPHMEYHWVNDGYLVDTLAQDTRYTQTTPRPGFTALTISKPHRGDTGDYECYFTLNTNQGPLTLKEVIHLDATRLKVSGAETLQVTHTLLLLIGVLGTMLYTADTWWC